MTAFEVRQRAQAEAAAGRLASRASERRETIDALQAPGGLARADAPERIAKRLDRLTRYYAGESLPAAAGDTPTGDPEEVLASALDRGTLPEQTALPGEALRAPGVVLERIINTPDFVDIRYLEAGTAAARAVCRIRIRDEAERIVGHGTGSLVSPRLLLTNHHVLENADVARSSVAEFNFQDGLDRQPLEPRLFQLDPDSFFVADQERDFALVAVGASAGELAPFGFNPLIGAEGKAIIGEFVTIVQHPRGEKKQVSLRENRIVDVPEAFMHYEADTEPGSSGSPVFNNQWEVVALHHASVPAPDREELGGFMNEGIRVSRILQFLGEQQLSPEAEALLDELGTEPAVPAPTPAGSAGPSAATAPAGDQRDPGASASPPQAAAAPAGPPLQAADAPAGHLQAAAAPAGPLQASAAPGVSPGGEQGTIRVSLPLELTLRLAGAPAADAGRASPPNQASAGADEAIVIDPDYSNRRGYDPDFLGPGELTVPLPLLSQELLPKVAVTFEAGSDGLLDYHNFSVKMNKERRLAFFTAANIEGSLSRRLKREQDRWILDPRVPAEHQTGEPVYADNDLDRGHLVRRLDPAWGASDAIAKLANDDTFHFTNCTPQHKDFNQRQTSWAGLEDYVLDNADNRDFKVSVVTGPVFADDDDEYRGVALPRQFWKVVVMVKAPGRLSATAYLLSQASLLEGLETDEEFSYGAYRTFQVPMARVERLTGLSFGPLSGFDPLAGLEALEVREIRSDLDLVL